MAVFIQRTYTIGRTDLVDIQVFEESVSRKHAEITVFDDSLSIKDLSSANGTFIDHRQSPANCILLLHIGNVIHLGDSPNFLVVKEGKVRNDAEDKEEDGRKGRNGQGRIDMSNGAEMMKRKQKNDENTFIEKMNKEKIIDKDNYKSNQLSSASNSQQHQQFQSQISSQSSSISSQQNSQKLLQGSYKDEGKQQKEKGSERNNRVEHYDRERSRSKDKDSVQSASSSGKALDAKEKRKLLWSNKKVDDLETKAQIYGKVEASSEETNKFFKLMGFKQSVEGKQVSVGAERYSIEKTADTTKKVMIYELENQFNEGVKRKCGGKNGIGFN